MSSEAMVDSRGYEILNAEEVEELKKVRVLFQYPTMSGGQQRCATRLTSRWSG
jgi:hypothetical protein